MWGQEAASSNWDNRPVSLPPDTIRVAYRQFEWRKTANGKEEAWASDWPEGKWIDGQTYGWLHKVCMSEH